MRLTEPLIPYEHPPRLRNAEGAVRSVGVEVEFTGLDTRSAAEALHRGLGGKLGREDPYAFPIERSAIGDLLVKLDTRYAHSDLDQDGLAGALREYLGAWFTSVADPLIPRELVTDPIPITALDGLDAATAVLREAGAGGTRAGGLRPLALHLNPETPDFEPDTVTAQLKAFALLNDWLREESDPARLRMLLSYFGRYPEEYVRRLAEPGYWPDMPGVIDDYLAANPTRNRDLDALPLLLYIDEPRVRARLPDEKIGRRPTFHYRLPDSRVGDPGWSVARSWNRWVAVERVAADPPRLGELCRAYLSSSAGEAWAGLSERIALG